jgi:hypothetical protein
MAKIIGLILGVLVGEFLCNALVVWVLCWGLKAIGITTICGWTVNFSWALAVLFTVATIVLHSIFRGGKNE